MVWRAPSGYGCTWEVGRELKTLELLSLGYRLEQLLRFFRALPTSQVHPQFDGARQTMNHFLSNVTHAT